MEGDGMVCVRNLRIGWKVVMELNDLVVALSELVGV